MIKQDSKQSPFLITLFISCLLLPLLSSFSIAPLVYSFAPKGEEATHNFTLYNDNNAPAAIQISMWQRECRLNGEDILSEADDHFIVYPTQVVLMPFEQQTVRVSWIHNPNPSQELAYRLIAEELPIALEDPTNNTKNKKGGMQMLMRYLTALYIVPNNVEPNVKLQSALKESDEEGNALLAITLNNEGKARTVLKDFSLNIKDSAGNEVHFSPEEIPEINRKVLLAKMQRRYVLPWPKNLNEDITVNFDFEIAQ